MSTRPHDPTRRQAVATRVGPYVLQTRLGEGGMGIVHLAQAPDGRRVALKVLRPQIVGDEEARGRLAREVGSLTRVRSPWIAEIIDADPWADVPYVVTRYVPGFSLHEQVATEGPITGSDLRWLAGCLAEGLAAVHLAGVLHRDVKPGNVLMEGRTPILIDFGLARVADDARLTQTGWLLGTPGYLAPEILYGDDATPAADVHAWAATVAYAATGRAPYGRGPSMAIMDRTRRGQHDLAGIEQPLADVLAAALSPDPLDRPLLEEVLAWLRPLSTRPELPAVPPPGVLFADTGPTVPLALAGDLDVPGAPPPPPPAATPLLPPPPPAEAVAPAPAAAFAGAPVPGEPPGLAPTAHLPVEGPYDPLAPFDPAPQPRVPLPERSRRWAVVGLLAVLLGSATAAAPWLTLATSVVVVWVVRAGSLAVSARDLRRAQRGARWYDAPRLLLGAPWHLVRATSGALLLLLWSVGLAAAGGLICYAAALETSTTLLVSGTVFGGALWSGPGADRLRSPLTRVLAPACRTTLPWLATCGLLLGAALGLALLLASEGVSWAPWTSGPFGL